MSYSPDGRHLAATGFDGKVDIWDPATLRSVPAFRGGPRNVETAKYSPNGRMLACDGLVRLYDPVTGSERAPHETGELGSSAFHPNGKLLAVAGNDETVRFWDIASNQVVRRMKTGETDNRVKSLAFSPDGENLAWIQGDDKLRFAEVAKVDVVRTLTKGRTAHDDASAFEFRPDGKSLAVVSSGGSLRLIDESTGDELVRYLEKGEEVLAIAFSKDGGFLLAGGRNGFLRIWEVVSGKEVLRLRGHEDMVRAVAFAPDGRTVASGGHEHFILIWDATGVEDQPGLSKGELSDQELRHLWDDLASPDAALAYRAIWRLRGNLPKAVPFIGRELLPATPMADEQFAVWIAQLDDEQFSVREGAYKKLEASDDRAESALRKEIASPRSEEVRSRCEALLRVLNKKTFGTESLREHRALAVLEFASKPEDLERLEKLIQAAPSGRLTREAANFLDRVRKHQPPQ